MYVAMQFSILFWVVDWMFCVVSRAMLVVLECVLLCDCWVGGLGALGARALFCRC